MISVWEGQETLAGWRARAEACCLHLELITWLGIWNNSDASMCVCVCVHAPQHTHTHTIAQLFQSRTLHTYKAVVPQDGNRSGKFLLLSNSPVPFPCSGVFSRMVFSVLRHSVLYAAGSGWCQVPGFPSATWDTWLGFLVPNLAWFSPGYWHDSESKRVNENSFSLPTPSHSTFQIKE